MEKWVSIGMFISWFVLGIMTFIIGKVTMVTFACIWVCYMVEIGEDIYNQHWRSFK